MCVQGGSYCPHVLEDFFLLWDGQQLLPVPELPDGEAKEVQPFCQVHTPGFSFVQCHTSFLEQLFPVVAWRRFPRRPVSEPFSQSHRRSV